METLELPRKFELRPYQLDTFEKLDEALINRRERSTIMALPTGSGKTVTAVTWLNERFLKHGLNCLWFVHRIELLKQAQETFAAVCPEVKVSLWTADGKDADGQVVLAMILSSRSLNRHFDIVVVDEAHHAAMATYRTKLQELDTDFVLGLTATPTRLDNKDLGFESIATQYSVLDLVQQGYLAKPVYVRVRTGQKHKMKIQAGDFSGSSLRQLDNLARNELVAKIWSEDCERWGKTLVFCCDIEHSDHLDMVLNAEATKKGMFPGTITTVHSLLPQSVRASRVERFREGRSKVMINVGVFTEGFDVPDIRSIFMTRPTASETLYLQMIGRGTRITGGKDGFFVVDFVDELGKYSLLANRWAVQHLGAENEEEKIRESEALQRALELLQRRGVDPNLIRNVQKDFVLFAGLLEYKGQFDQRPVMIAMTRELHLAWSKLRIALRSGDKTKNIIEGMYAWANVSETGMTLAQWKNLGWCTYFDNVGAKHRGWIRFLEFQPIKLEGDAKLMDEVHEAINGHRELNQRMESADEIKKLSDQLSAEIARYTGLDGFVCQLSYRNSILNVQTNIQRDSMRGSDREAIREILTNIAASYLDVELELVLRWS
jgi:superfamily II DNA or RNA helicase